MFDDEHLRANLELPDHMPYLVTLKMAGGYLLGEEAQDQRDQLAEWFFVSGIKEEDVESAFCDKKGCPPAWTSQAAFMVFAFLDPKKAMLFKLAWGGK